MVFGKKKEKFAKVEQPEEIYEEDEEVKPIPQPYKTPKQLVQEKPKREATLIATEVMEDGRFRSVFISNSPMGTIGESFDLDE